MFNGIDNNSRGNMPCDKVCIQTKKVFDACIKQATLENVVITLNDLNPANPALPLKFVGGRSIAVAGEVTNLSVERLADRPRYGRVECDVVIPVEITYTDNNGEEGVGYGTVTIHEDVILLLPEASIMPYQVEATASVVIPDGVFESGVEGDYVFNVTTCVSVIVKIVINVELIVPTYGYAVIPPCQEYSQEVCAGFFDLPLFPNSNT